MLAQGRCSGPAADPVDHGGGGPLRDMVKDGQPPAAFLNHCRFLEHLRSVIPPSAYTSGLSRRISGLAVEVSKTVT